MDDPLSLVDGPEIIGRDDELAGIRSLWRAAADRLHMLVLVGEPGVGKTALLDRAATDAARDGRRILRVHGSEDESELAFAGLHQLLRPVLPDVETLPPRQRDALRQVFGLGEPGSDGTSPAARESSRLFMYMGALTLLSDLAARQPLLVAVDDVHVLDPESLDVLAFIARRLAGEPIAVLATARGNALPDQFRAYFVRLPVEPLDRRTAGVLLDHQPHSPSDRTRARILDQAAGNPLALIELSRAAAQQPDADEDGPEQSALSLPDRLTHIFTAQLSALPEPTRRLLLLAAAGSDDLTAVHAAARTNTGVDAWGPAKDAGLVRIVEGRIRFRHPLVRAAVYQAAALTDRHAAHRALAAALADEPDRRAWHLAASTIGTDEQIAAALEGTADRSRLRGGYIAGARALERAAQLTPEPEQRARRLAAAATLAMFAGHPRRVGDIAARVTTLTDDPVLVSEASRRAGWALAVTTRYADSLGFLLPAAREAVEADPEGALDALGTATPPAYNSGDPQHRRAVLDIADRIVGHEDNVDLIWTYAGCDPFGSRARVLPALRRVARERELALGELVVLGGAAWVLDETDEAVRLLGRAMEHLRHTATAGSNGTVAQCLALSLVERGAWTAARSTMEEAARTAVEAGLEVVTVSNPLLHASLLALQGDAEQARAMVTEAVESVEMSNSLALLARSRHVLGMAAVADGDHDTAYRHLRSLFGHEPGCAPLHYHFSPYAVADLAGAAVRSGRTAAAEAVLTAVRGHVGGNASARLTSLLHRAAALLCEPSRAERHFRAALADPDGDQWPFERAQVRLDYAEWLRRQRRTKAARPQLAAALEVFESYGARPWTERAAAELRAAGVSTARTTSVSTALAELSPQQLQIARLAAAGLTNRQIGERLFISPRTVGSHLYQIFPKLGVTTRAQLRDVLSEAP